MTAELKCIPLVGAVGGSIALNLANKNSDIDFYLVTESQEEVDIHRTVHCDGEKIDFMCVPLNELIKECVIYFNREHKYPTRFYRTQLENDAVTQKRDVDRPDFKREMIMRVFLADEILEFKNGIVKKVYEDLKQGLLLIDIWDYHFNRAYGNYYESVKQQEKVLLRKYLYIISQITICHMILSNNKITMDYRQMLKESDCIREDLEIHKICVYLWEENKKRTIKKNESYVISEPKLNEWIERNLEELLHDMIEKEEFLRNQFFVYDANKVKEVKMCIF